MIEGLGKDKSEAYKQAAKDIIKVLEQKAPYLFEIEQQVRRTDNGLVTCTIRIYKGKVSDVVFNETRRIVFK